MKNKNKLVVLSSVLALGLIAAVPAFAQTSSSTGENHKNAPVLSSSTISCVGTAVNTRETAIDTAISTHQAAVSAAYTARATALSQAYSLSTASAIRSAVKSAWSAFESSIKSAAKDWRTAQKSAWSNFRTAAKACKAPMSINDNGNSSSEVSGN